MTSPARRCGSPAWRPPEYLWPAKSRQEVLVAADDFAVVFVPEPLAERLAHSGANQRRSIDGGQPDTAPRTAPVGDRPRRPARPRRRPAPSSPPTARCSRTSRASARWPSCSRCCSCSPAGWRARSCSPASSPRSVRSSARCAPPASRARAVVRHYLGFGLVAGLGGALLGALPASCWAAHHVYTRESRSRSPSPPVGVDAHRGRRVGLSPGWPPRPRRRSPRARSRRPRRCARRAPRRRAPQPWPSGSCRRCALPARWKLVPRRIGAQPAAARLHRAGVVLALTLVLVSWGMIDTDRRPDHRQFTRSSAGREVASPVPSAPPSVAGCAPDGVARAEPVARPRSSSATARPLRERAARATNPDQDARVPPPRRRDHAARRRILVGAAMRDQLTCAPAIGSRHRAGAEGITRGPVPNFLDEQLGTYAYLDRLARRWCAANRPRARKPRGALRHGRRRAAAARDRRAPRGRRRLPTRARSSMRCSRSLGLFYVIVGVMLVFGGLMASALIFNTMSANVAERAAETAALRAAGAGSRATLGRLIAAENALVVVAGIAPRPARRLRGRTRCSWPRTAPTGTASTSTCAPRRRSSPRWRSCSSPCSPSYPGLRAVRHLDIARIVRERSL